MAIRPAIRKGKQNRHEKITVCLLSGKPVTITEIKSVFKGTDQEALMYRLSSNIYSIRRDGGVIKVHKTGKEVTAYQLMNFDRFDKDGRFMHPSFQSKLVPGLKVESEDTTDVTLKSVPKLSELIEA
jgi:hypothetical protein